ncbi:MAG: MmcQ/YjbR family DNA-binding protein [Geminicoccaceae bacterium]
MREAEIEAFCLALPGTTLTVQWQDHRVLKVGGKMFAITGADGGIRFKCSAVSFAILTEIDGIIPSPYLARAHWVKLERLDLLPDDQLLDYLRMAWGLVVQKLPQKLRRQLMDEMTGRGGRTH